MYGAKLLKFDGLLFNNRQVRYFLSKNEYFDYVVDRNSVDIKEIMFGAQMSMTARKLTVSHTLLPAGSKI